MTVDDHGASVASVSDCDGSWSLALSLVHIEGWFPLTSDLVAGVVRLWRWILWLRRGGRRLRIRGRTVVV